MLCLIGVKKGDESETIHYVVERAKKENGGGWGFSPMPTFFFSSKNRKKMGKEVTLKRKL